MGLTPVSATLSGLGNSALYPSGVSASGQPTTPSSGGAALPNDVATLSSSSGNAPSGTNAGLYSIPSAVIFRIQLDRLAFEFTQTSTVPTASSSADGTSNTAATDAADGAHGGGKFRKALEALGLDPTTINEFLRVAKLLKHFDAAAYRDFVQQIENLANALQTGRSPATTAASSDTSVPEALPQPQPENAGQTTPSTNQQAMASAEAPATGTPQVQVDLTSFQLTETQIQITDTAGKNGQTVDVSAETLSVNFAELQAAFASRQDAGAPQSSGDGSSPTDSRSQGSKVNVNA